MNCSRHVLKLLLIPILALGCTAKQKGIDTIETSDHCPTVVLEGDTYEEGSENATCSPDLGPVAMSRSLLTSSASLDERFEFATVAHHVYLRTGDSRYQAGAIEMYDAMIGDSDLSWQDDHPELLSRREELKGASQPQVSCLDKQIVRRELRQQGCRMRRCIQETEGSVTFDLRMKDGRGYVVDTTVNSLDSDTLTCLETAFSEVEVPRTSQATPVRYSMSIGR